MRVPVFKDAEITKFLVDFDRDVQRVRQESLSNITANKSLLLYSPSLKVYEIKVDDAGVITSTKVAG